jgi:LDH2 family malate/lactate/ureidoglycolate dehydrogenase
MPESLQTVRIERARLEAFCQRVFEALELPEDDARIAAAVLVAADARGIPSHGVARLKRYVKGLRSGLMLADATTDILSDTPTSILVRANGAMGAPVSARTMQAVIDKARSSGAAFGCVRDSNHFGIAGFYAMMALDYDMIGITMTNSAPLAVPTFGRQIMTGTNPIAFAAPAEAEKAFVLDMSTTVVTRGKIEVYDRLGKELPEGWAVDRTGQPARNARSVLDDVSQRVGGGILPLGGAGELLGGHKGYGLSVLVDILCGVLSGGAFGRGLYDTPKSMARVAHFFGAVRIDTFRAPQDFRRDMDDLLRKLRETPPAGGAERVYVAGQKEFEREAEALRLGVPILGKTYDEIQDIGRELGVSPVKAND